MDERYMGDIPDEIPEEALTPLDNEMQAITRDLHNRLKLRTAEVTRRRTEVQKKYNIVIDPVSQTDVRMTLLVKHGLGADTAGRFAFELEWMDIVQGTLEQALNEFQRQERAKKDAKHLHLPNGRVLEIPGENNGK